jgi:hypothetical protein
MTELWNLAVHTTIAGDAILAVLARLVTPPEDDNAAAADRLDAATALLVSVGESAGKLRAAIGLDSATDHSGAAVPQPWKRNTPPKSVRRAGNWPVVVPEAVPEVVFRNSATELTSGTVPGMATAHDDTRRHLPSA